MFKSRFVCRCLFISSETAKIRSERPNSTNSPPSWKAFGFRSADAHTRTRVRAGGGVEPAARSSHKPPDAQKEAAKKAENCAQRSDEREGKNRAEPGRAGPGRDAPLSRDSALLPLCGMEQPRTRCRRQKRRSSSANEQIKARSGGSIPLGSLPLFFHFSRVMHVHALRGGKKKGVCAARRATRVGKSGL